MYSCVKVVYRKVMLGMLLKPNCDLIATRSQLVIAVEHDFCSLNLKLIATSLILNCIQVINRYSYEEESYDLYR